MLVDIIKIAGLCIVVGVASIPLSFGVNSSPVIVWLGNALGSLLSAIFVVVIGNKLTSNKSKDKMREKRFSKKIVTIFEEGNDNKKVLKARIMIDKHGLRYFAFFCPIFPGVLISTVVVYLFELDKKTYLRWMIAGIFFASGLYVFGYWWTFVKPN